MKAIRHNPQMFDEHDAKAALVVTVLDYEPYLHSLRVSQL